MVTFVVSIPLTSVPDTRQQGGGSYAPANAITLRSYERSQPVFAYEYTVNVVSERTKTVTNTRTNTFTATTTSLALVTSSSTTFQTTTAQTTVTSQLPLSIERAVRAFVSFAAVVAEARSQSTSFTQTVLFTNRRSKALAAIYSTYTPPVSTVMETTTALLPEICATYVLVYPEACDFCILSSQQRQDD